MTKCLSLLIFISSMLMAIALDVERMNIKSCANIICPYNLNPVCAMGKDGEQTFDNQCILDGANCGTKSFDKICDGACPCRKSDLARSCGPVACPKNYSPICAMGKDGEQTFANQCLFNGANCGQNVFDKICDGECPCKKNEPKVCNQICTREYKPVCAMNKDGEQTFANQCVLNGANCLGKSFDKICDGECPCKKSDLARSCGPLACPDIYRPICALSKDGEKTFDNQCMLDGANCVTKSFDKICDGECPCVKKTTDECNAKCTKEYNPICGLSKDGERTFANKCLFEFANCGQKSFDKLCNGECPCYLKSAPKKVCNQICTREYKPVCGMSKDGERTFGNQCMLDGANCETKSFDKICDGECPCKKSDLARSTEPCGNKICPYNYSPVCAMSKDGEQTFGNQCMLDGANCGTKSFDKICDGECPCKRSELARSPKACGPIVCPANYSPICAMSKDGEKTFPNQCMLNSANCGQKSFDKICEGECPCKKSDLARSTKVCSQICTREYKPVCGMSKDGERTFANNCMFESANCLEKTFDKLCDGECPCYY